MDVAATLRSIRHAYCDCVLLVSSLAEAEDGNVAVDSNAGHAEARTAILAHRAVLARAPYFAALLVRSPPLRVETLPPSTDGKGYVVRAVYEIDVPLAVETLAFLVDHLYDSQVGIDKTTRADLADIVRGALFLGLATNDVDAVIKSSLRVLLEALATKDHTDADRESLYAFVRHMLAGDAGEDTKRNVLSRVLGLFAPSQRDSIVAAHGNLVPARYYQPDVATDGGVRVDADGRRWHVARIMRDRLRRQGRFKSERCRRPGAVTWRDLVLDVHVTRNLDGTRADEILVSCAPTNESLSVYKPKATSRTGVVRMPLRVARFTLYGYHPTGPAVSAPLVPSESLRVDGCRPTCSTPLAADQVYVPFDMGTRSPLYAVSRTRHAFAIPEEYVWHDSSLFAYEIEVLVEDADL